MRFYKLENGIKMYAGNSIEYNNKQVINPTSEILQEAGYTAESEELTDEEKLCQTIEKKLQDIVDYDSSDAVNSFTYQGLVSWLDAETRANYLTSISSAELLGETSITFAIAGQAVTVPLQNAKILLAKIQRYADASYLVTQQHIAEVSKLTTVAEVEAFDITQGYPEKLSF